MLNAHDAHLPSFSLYDDALMTMPSDQRLRLTEAKIERAFCRRHRHRWRHQSLDGANCTGCGNVTRLEQPRATPIAVLISWPTTHARFHAGGICFRFLGSSALSIARLAAVIAASLLSDVPDFVPVSVSTDHFQRPRWIPWIIRYSTPRCSMLSLPLRRAWSILLRWVRLCWRPSVWTFDKFE